MKNQTFTLRLLKLAVLLSSMLCYLEWGQTNSSFIFEVEYSVLSMNGSADSFMHPLIILPVIGQVLMLVSICMKHHSKVVTNLGILLLGSLVVVILFVGLLSLNPRTIISTIPFIAFTSFYFVMPGRSRAMFYQ
jgi:hypothetical protein